jgi:hypothetical protein
VTCRSTRHPRTHVPEVTWLRRPTARARVREPVPGLPEHGLGGRRWLRSVNGRTGRFRLPAARRARRRVARSPAGRGDHRPPGAAAGLAATGRASRTPRLRGRRPSARTGGAGRGRHRARDAREMPPEPLDSAILFARWVTWSPRPCGPSTGAPRGDHRKPRRRRSRAAPRERAVPREGGAQRHLPHPRGTSTRRPYWRTTCPEERGGTHDAPTASPARFTPSRP